MNKWRRALEIAGVEFIEEDDAKTLALRVDVGMQARQSKRKGEAS